jgi:hypothetical protein
MRVLTQRPVERDRREARREQSQYLFKRSYPVLNEVLYS